IRLWRGSWFEHAWRRWRGGGDGATDARWLHHGVYDRWPKGPALHRENGRGLTGEEDGPSDRARDHGPRSLLDAAQLGPVSNSPAIHARASLRSTAHL